MKTKSIVIAMIAVFSIFNFVSAQTVKQMNSTEIQQIILINKKIVVLDVRTPQEFNAGHLKDAINIDIYERDFYSRIDKLDKKAIYVVYCRTHNRSTAAVQYMRQKGFVMVYQMMDGFPGWAANKLPFIK